MKSPRILSVLKGLVLFALFSSAGWMLDAEDISTIAGPPAVPDYAQDGPVKIRFSSYLERSFPGTSTPGAPRLLNVPQGGKAKLYTEKLAAIDADEGFVYVPGETVQIHVKSTGPATIEIRGMRSGRKATQQVDGEATIPWALEPAGGKDDVELYQVEAQQGGKVAARRGFVSMLPTGDVHSVHDIMGTTGWEFIEWTYSPFDIVCGFPEAGSKNHPPLSGRFDYRLQPWNWVADVYAPDLPKYGMRAADWSQDLFAQPYTEWARWYQYFGADLTMWTPDSWRWGEFNTGDIEHRMKPAYGSGTPGFPAGNYIVTNDSVMPNGMYFREWLGQIYYAAMKQACEMKKGTKTRIAEADHWNDRDDDVIAPHPRMLEMYLDYLKAKGLPHDDLDKAKNSAELTDLVTKTGTQERRDHYRAWNMFQVNLRGRQYLWESAVKAAIDVNGYDKVDWLFGNGLVGDTLVIQGQGNPTWVHQDLEQQIAPWSRFEFQTDWDFMHWGSGSYRFAGQAFARMGALIGHRILSPDVYNENVPHANPKARIDARYSMWSVPQNAAEHNRMFTYTSFMHYYDANGQPQRVVNLDYEDIYRNSQGNSLGILTDQTPGPEAHAILDHRQVSESVTMDRPIGFVGVISSPRTADIASKTEYVVNADAWPWYFETLVDDGVSLPAFVDAQAVSKLPDTTNLIFAPRKDGQGKMVVSARIGGQTITRPWKPKDRAALADFADAIKKAANDPVKFSEGATGFAYTFRGNRALVYVENMRSPDESESRDSVRQADAHEQPRVATVDIALPFAAQGAQVWDLTGFLPVRQVQADATGNRLVFTAPLRAGDGRLFVIIPPDGANAIAAKIAGASATASNATLDQLSVPWLPTAYEQVSYRNALFLPTPQPYGPRNYTQLDDKDAPPAQVPGRATAAIQGVLTLKGASPLLKIIAPAAVVVVGKDAPDSIKAAAQALADALHKAGGAGQIFTAEDFNKKPVSETGQYHVLAVGTIWDNEVLQRFNDPWAMDRDWYYGRLGNQPAWPWMPRTGFTVGWVGDFDAKDDGVGYLCVDRSSFMWEARCKAFDDKKAPDQQMPLRFLFRISGSGPAGVVKAVKAFADDGMLNGCLAGTSAPTGDARFSLTPDRMLAHLVIDVPQKIAVAGGVHNLTYLGWNQADGEEYDGFFSKTGVEAKRIVRAKYVPEWGMTNFVSSPHRASSRFELCVIDLADAASAKQAADKLAGSDGQSLTLADGTPARRARYGTEIVVKGNTLILESAPQPWGQALLEAYLQKK